MAVQSAVSRCRVHNSAGTGSYWDLVATAAVQDTPAGTAVTITSTMSSFTATFAPPTVPDSAQIVVFVDNTQVTVSSWGTAIGNGATTVHTFYLTDNGQVGGSPRCGTLRIRTSMTNSTAPLTSNRYIVTSDNGEYGTAPNTHSTGTGSTGISAPFQYSGVIRGTCTATTVLPGGGTLGYGDSVTATTTLNAAPYASRTVQVALSPLSVVASAASSSSVFTTTLGSVDNRFASGANALSTVTTFPNASVWATPWTSATKTETTRTVDPRLTFTHLLQKNTNTFASPPMNNNIASKQRLASDLGFIAGRVTNANGTGVNGITWTMTLQDSNALTTAFSASYSSGNNGGQDGWGALTSWASQLPTGNWIKAVTITAPAGAVGLGSNTTENYTLVAANPNYRMICAGGPGTGETDSRHFTPGEMSFLVGMEVFNTESLRTMALDTDPVPSVAIGRFNLTYGMAEYLGADGITWIPATYTFDGMGAVTGFATAYYHALAVPGPADPHAWVKLFSAEQTANWGPSDIFIIGRAFIGGVPVNDFFKEVSVTGKNNHTRYAFDGPGFLGFPTR